MVADPGERFFLGAGFEKSSSRHVDTLTEVRNLHLILLYLVHFLNSYLTLNSRAPLNLTASCFINSSPSQLKANMDLVLKTVKMTDGLLNECNLIWREWAPPGIPHFIDPFSSNLFSNFM